MEVLVCILVLRTLPELQTRPNWGAKEASGPHHIICTVIAMNFRC